MTNSYYRRTNLKYTTRKHTNEETNNNKKSRTTKYKENKNIELIRTIVHGVLHLSGYKDKTKKEKEIMTTKENKYLSLYKKI